MQEEPKTGLIERETAVIRAFQRKTDQISRLILDTDLPWIDIEIQIERLGNEAAELFPGKETLFDLIYRSRFRRLRTQWRKEKEEVSYDGD